MKKTLLYFILSAITITGFAQAAYIQPSPTGKNDTITLYINVAATTDGSNNNALNAMLNDHPDDSVYIWSWMPAEPTVGNGQWENSNQALKMTKVSDKLYSIRFKPTSFYGVDATSFFTKGISCLAKLKNGKEYDGLYPGEAKTEDLKINIIPRLCDELYCIFPEIAKTDDYLSITYDNNQETNANLQNLGDDDCYLFVRAEQGVFTAFNYTTPELATSTPELKMKPVPDKEGFFRITFIPEDLFSGILPANFDFKTLKFYVLKPGFVYTTAPPFQSFTFLDCN
jgi:hypothetical protein